VIRDDPPQSVASAFPFVPLRQTKTIPRSDGVAQPNPLGHRQLPCFLRHDSITAFASCDSRCCRLRGPVRRIRTGGSRQTGLIVLTEEEKKRA